MPDKRTSAMPGHSPIRKPVDNAPPRTRACRSCRTPTTVGRLVGGECPDCAGLIPLPLRGEGGRFLPGLTTTSTPAPSGGPSRRSSS
jgi:hypothetical protein